MLNEEKIKIMNKLAEILVISPPLFLPLLLIAQQNILVYSNKNVVKKM